MQQIQLSTSKKLQLLNITQKVSQLVADSKIKEGVCLVFAPHASAAILINEDEPGFKTDMEILIRRWIPEGTWEHNKVDSNATAHLASSLIGQSRTIPVKDGKLVLGTWQEIFFVELDGPRSSRHVIVQLVGS
jgi:secondary thiamine-phosphate synthase enzyme